MVIQSIMQYPQQLCTIRVQIRIFLADLSNNKFDVERFEAINSYCEKCNIPKFRRDSQSLVSDMSRFSNDIKSVVNIMYGETIGNERVVEAEYN